MTRYTVLPTVPDKVRNELAAYDPLTIQLLFNRGVVTAAEAVSFMDPDYDAHQHDPFLLNDMTVAVERVLSAIEKKERICIFSDYDCDGIPGGVVLHDFFKAISYENFFNYIPHRHYEGFGLNETAVEKIKNDGADLIVTIDCGTSSNEAIAVANAAGIDVVVTDHHEPPAKLPEAVAIVNPKVGNSYPFTELCGSGVVFKLIQALIAKGDFNLKPGWEKWWLDMVGVATIADMVPLVNENRVFATYGLQVLRKSRRPGLQKLLKKARADQRFLTEDDVGFTIGPRINAASRMDTPEDAFFMLAATDETEAGERVEHLEKLNNERKGVVAAMSKDLHKRLDVMVEMPSVLVFGNPDWRPSLVGLAAGKLAELYGRPAFIWGRDGNGVIKGSARGGGDMSVVRLMEAVPKETWLEFGGHHQAGGFSVADNAIHTLGEALAEAALMLGDAARAEEALAIDANLVLEDVNHVTIGRLKKIGPFGVGNHKPLFRFAGVSPKSVELFGKTKEHTKVLFDAAGSTVEAISFFKTPEQFSVTPEINKAHTLLAHLEESFFMGRRQIRLRIVDVCE